MRRTRSTSRRTLLASTAAVSALALSLTACGGGGESTAGGSQDGDVTNLTWQMWSSSEIETEALERLSEMVTEEHPNIRLTLQTAPFGDYWTKLAAQASGGDTGCILGVQGPRTRSIAQLLMPLDEGMLGEAGVDLGEFDPAIVEATQVDGEQLAVPYDLGPLVVYYNADAFEQAGVPLPAPGWTLADFEAAARALDATGMDGYAVFPTIDTFAAWALTLQGRQPITEDGELQLTAPEMVSTFEYLQNLVASGVSPQLPATNDAGVALSAFMAGDAAMVVDGPWQLGNVLENAQFEAAVAPMPAGPQGSRTHVAGSGYGISAGCEYPEEAMQAIATITGAEAQEYLGEIGRAFPARTAQQEAWFQGEFAAAEPAITAANSNAEPFHSVENITQLSQLFQQYGIPALNGQQGAAEFLELVQSQAGGGS